MAITQKEIDRLLIRYEELLTQIENTQQFNNLFLRKIRKWILKLWSTMLNNENVESELPINTVDLFNIVPSNINPAWDKMIYVVGEINKWDKLMHDFYDYQEDDEYNDEENSNNVDVISDYQNKIQLKYLVKLAYNCFAQYVETTKQIRFSAKNSPISNLTYTLYALQITHYHFINNITIKNLDSNLQFIVFTGDNGIGKTLILQAITSILSTDEISSRYINNKAHLFLGYKDKIYLGYIRLGQKKTPLSISAYYEQKNRPINIALPICMAYGASRLEIQNPESMSEVSFSDTESLFKSNSILQNIEYQFQIWKLRNESEKIDKVSKVLLRLLPYIDDIIMDKEVVYYVQNGNKTSINQLSAGQKSIVAMIGDMIIRFYQRQPNVKNIFDFEGIVLIDELEAHLHPKWQREFPRLLSEIFPKVQFIVTTHSAITFLGMPSNSAFYHVTSDAEKGTQVEKIEIDIENLLPNQILTSPIFGMENIKHIENKNSNQVHTEENYAEILKREEVKKALKEATKDFKFPPLVKKN